MPYKRDPVSELFDSGASALLARAYARGPGAWTSTRLALPSAAHLAWAAGQGINLYAADERGARTRWNRAFIRSVYYLNKGPGRPAAIRYRVHREGPLHWRIRILLAESGSGGLARVPAAARFTDPDNDTARRAPDDQLDWAITSGG